MKAKLWITATIGCALLSACGQAPPTSEGAQQEGAGAQGSGSLKSVSAKLEGLDGKAWIDQATELAADESGKITWYTSMDLEDSKPMAEKFTEKYGIEVKIYRASAEDIQRRIIQEGKADRVGADVVNASAAPIEIIDREGLLAPLETPSKGEIVKSARFKDWAGIYRSVFAATWNTDRLSKSEYPETWEDVLSDYPGKLAIEAGDWDWFATLVQQYFMKKKGMTEDEAVGLFRQAMRKATPVSGHTGMVELLAAGEFGITSNAYVKSSYFLRKEDGAPVAWEPAVEPLIARPNGIGVTRAADAPASSLLFIEFMLSDAQEMMADFGRTPANINYSGPVPDKYKLISVNTRGLLDEQKKWGDLFQQIISSSGKKVIDE